jgi:hypothetical protein
LHVYQIRDVDNFLDLPEISSHASSDTILIRHFHSLAHPETKNRFQKDFTVQIISACKALPLPFRQGALAGIFTLFLHLPLLPQAAS